MRPIDGDALMEQVKAIHKEVNSINQDYNTGFHSATSQIQGLIASAPTLDVEPVRRGKWVWADDGYLRCSNCKQKAPVVPQYQDEPITTKTIYCPKCGAKMEVE